jgi:predicted Zn-dependent protease
MAGTGFKALAVLAVTGTVLLACDNQGAEAQSASAARSISATDKRQGAEAHPQLLQEFGGAYTGSQSAYVTSVGRRIAVQSGLSNSQQDFTITLLNSPVNNAFAIPGGYVYVTRQLLALMNDEAELASVLGHEVGHVAARHSSKRNTRSTLGSLGSVLVGVLTGSSELMQVAGQAAQMYTLSYSRSQEYQADDLGIRYLAKAGYDPAAAADILDSLEAQSTLEARATGQEREGVPTWARSHPNTPDRVARARREAAKTGATGGNRNRDAFLTALNGVAYDDDPRQGIIDGAKFRHPDLKLQFQAPAGFAMQNSPSAVIVSGNGGQAQFGGGALSGGLNDYIAKVFQGVAGNQGQIQFSQPQRTTINGLEAAASTARANTQSGQVDVTVTAYQFAPNTAYHFVTITPAGSGLGPLRPLIQSVRRLSDSEAAQIRARRVEVVTVKAGDTARSLSQRMAYGSFQLERFLTLNALAANQGLRPGDRVKLVVYAAR